MVEKENIGFLAAQIEQAQRRIESWPAWLKEVTKVETRAEAEGIDSSEPNQLIKPVD